MKRVNITELPLFTFDNITSAFRIAELMYPEGLELYFPKGTYSVGQPITQSIRTDRTDGKPYMTNKIVRLYMRFKELPKPSFSFDTLLRAS